MSSRVSELIVRLRDQMSGPAKGAANALNSLSATAKSAGRGASTEMRRLTDELRKAQGVANRFDAFNKMRGELPKLRTDFNAARDRVKALAREMAATEAPTARMKAAMDRARNEVKKASAAFQQKAQAIAQARSALQQMGVATDRLSASQRTVKGAIAAATAAIERQEQVEKRAARAAEVAAQKREQAARRAAIAEEARLQRQQRRAEFVSGATGVVAGTYVAGQMIARPVAKALTFDERLTRIAATLEGDGTVADKQAAKARVSDAIDDALVRGGGTREGAAAALDTVVASGTVDGDAALKMLPVLTKAAHASGADEQDIARLGVALLNNGVKLEQLPEALDRAMRAGQLGGVELKDQARWLPQQLALARGSGLVGMPALTWLAAANQVALTTAATPDESGNNVVNLLQKLNSRELNKTLADVVTPEIGDPTTPGKVTGKGKNRKQAPAEFDWGRYMVQRQKEGVSAPEAFGEILDRQLKNNEEYGDLLAKAAAANTPEDARANLEAAASIAEGTELGRVLADRQALMAAIALRAGRERLKALEAELAKAKGAIDKESEFVRAQTWSKKQDAANTLDRANEQAYGAIDGPLGALISGINDAARAFPELTAAVYGGSQVIGAVGAGGLVGSAAALIGSARALDTSAAALMAAAKAQGGLDIPGGGDKGKKGGKLDLGALKGAGPAGKAVAAVEWLYNNQPEPPRLITPEEREKLLKENPGKELPFHLGDWVRGLFSSPKPGIGALGTVPAGDATLGGAGRFSPDRALANTSTSRGFIQDPKGFAYGDAPVASVKAVAVGAGTPEGGPLPKPPEIGGPAAPQLDPVTVDLTPIRNAAIEMRGTMSEALEAIKSEGLAVANEIRSAFSFNVTPKVNWPAAPSWGAGGGQRAIQSDVGLGTP